MPLPTAGALGSGAKEKKRSYVVAPQGALSEVAGQGQGNKVF